MTYYLKHYPISLLLVAAIVYLSFFTPPETDVNEIPYIDKVVHLCMYGGLCTVIWIEYLRIHQAIRWKRLLTGAFIFPILLSGLIEILQENCTATRSGDWQDFAANSIGASLALLMGYYVCRPLVWKHFNKHLPKGE